MKENKLVDLSKQFAVDIVNLCTEIKENIYETTEYLETFLRNLLLGENNELKNRYLHINNTFKAEISAIEQKVSAIDNPIAEKSFDIRTKTNIERLYNKLGTESIFGRGDVSEICGISYSTAGSLIAKLKEYNLITKAHGFGKGKYRFVV